MELLKKLGGTVIATAVMALTTCVVCDKYNQYANNPVAKAELKRKLSKINPFNKSH